MAKIGDIKLIARKDASRKGGTKRLSHIYATCQDCGNTRWVILREWRKRNHDHCHPCGNKYHHHHNSNSAHWGENNPRWKGGRILDKGGYVLVLIRPDDPLYAMGTKKNRDGIPRYVREHRLVMARALGRLLDRTEIVHHKDGNPQNNNLGNLELCIAGKHKLSYRAGYERGFADGQALPPSDLTTPVIQLLTPYSEIWRRLPRQSTKGCKGGGING